MQKNSHFRDSIKIWNPNDIEFDPHELFDTHTKNEVVKYSWVWEKKKQKKERKKKKK